MGTTAQPPPTGKGQQGSTGRGSAPNDPLSDFTAKPGSVKRLAPLESSRPLLQHGLPWTVAALIILLGLLLWLL
jgi:hypothetical protein